MDKYQRIHTLLYSSKWYAGQLWKIHERYSCFPLSIFSLAELRRLWGSVSYFMMSFYLVTLRSGPAYIFYIKYEPPRHLFCIPSPHDSITSGRDFRTPLSLPILSTLEFGKKISNHPCTQHSYPIILTLLAVSRILSTHFVHLSKGFPIVMKYVLYRWLQHSHSHGTNVFYHHL